MRLGHKYNFVIRRLFKDEKDPFKDQQGNHILREFDCSLFQTICDELKTKYPGSKANSKWNADFIKQFWLEVPGRPLDEEEKLANRIKAIKDAKKEERQLNEAFIMKLENERKAIEATNRKRQDTARAKVVKQAQEVIGTYRKTCD